MTWQSAIFPASRTSANVFLYLFVQLKNALSDAAKPAFAPGKLSLRAECRVWPKTKWTNKKVRNLCQAPNKIWSLIRLAVTCEVQSLHIIPSVGAAVMLLSFVFLAFCRWYKINHHFYHFVHLHQGSNHSSWTWNKSFHPVPSRGKFSLPLNCCDLHHMSGCVSVVLWVSVNTIGLMYMEERRARFDVITRRSITWNTSVMFTRNDEACQSRPAKMCLKAALTFDTCVRGLFPYVMIYRWSFSKWCSRFQD